MDNDNNINKAIRSELPGGQSARRVGAIIARAIAVSRFQTLSSKRMFLAGACMLLVSGCAALDPTERETATGKQIAQTMEDARSSMPAPEAPPPAVTDALIPAPVERPSDVIPPSEPRFDLNVENISARAFFMGLVRGTRYNMVVHPEVTGTITMSLKNVTIPEAMNMARDVYGYEYQRTSNGFLVLSMKVRTQIFEIDYLNVRRSGLTSTRISSGQSEILPAGSNGTSGTTGAVNTGGQSGSSVETESEADFWGMMKSTLVSMVGAGQGRSVIINAQTGTIAVRATPAELREIGRYLATVQSSAQRMVILEAKVIEVELSDSFRSGIDWAAFSSTTGSSTVIGQRGDGGKLIDLVDPASGGFVPFDPTAGLGVNPFGGVFSAALRIRNFAAFIEMLETQGRIEVLSSPRVTAMNNQKAVIKVGSDEYFVTSIASQTTVGTATSTSNNVQLTPFFSGISLDVTPQISADGWVTLHIQPTVSEVIDQAKSIPIGDQVQSVPLAFSSVRQSDSIVRARSGQVIVIGGLMRSQHNGDVSQPPGAGLLKGIGSLFQHTDQSDTKSELVILLRPIVPNDSTWSERIREQEQRLRTTGKRRRDGLR